MANKDTFCGMQPFVRVTSCGWVSTTAPIGGSHDVGLISLLGAVVVGIAGSDVVDSGRNASAEPHSVEAQGQHHFMYEAIAHVRWHMSTVSAVVTKQGHCGLCSFSWAAFSSELSRAAALTP